MGVRVTRREKQVLLLASRGYVAKAIGAQIGISDATVRVHLDSVRRKLGARNTANAVYLAVKEGVLAVDPGSA